MRQPDRARVDVGLAMVRILALLLFTLSVTAASPAPHVAKIGIAFPALEYLRFYNQNNFADVRDGLHADFVRTGWIPTQMMKHDKVPWDREDRAMHRLCRSGLNVMIITPSFKDDVKGQDHLYANIDEFFARYNEREPNCIAWAEIANEADLTQNSFPDVNAYARYYERVAPIAAKYGITVITTGTSGKDTPWTFRLAQLLHDAGAPVDGFGFHPYGIAPRAMREALDEMRQAASGASRQLPEVYVTELGVKDPDGLYNAIVDLAHSTPLITIFEYAEQHQDDSGYGLKDNPRLYRAAQRAIEHVSAISN